MTDRVQRQGNAPALAAGALLLIALAIGYYVVIALPAQAKERVAAVLQLEQLRQARDREREREVNDCLVNAYRTYNATWQLSCEKTERPLGCLLPTHLASALTQGLEKTQARCAKQVP